jgi:8-oxo-dGTP diphosphatase
MTPPHDDFYSRIPKRRMGAGVLFVNAAGDPLLVEPTYKPSWEIPGGIVEAGEDPRACATREVEEELGLEVVIGRMLVIDHRTDPPPKGDSIMTIYDGGVLSDLGTIRLQADELGSYQFVPVDELEQYVTERLAYRVREALRAQADGCTVEIINGVSIG